MILLDSIANHIAARILPRVEEVYALREEAEAGRFLAEQVSSVLNAEHRLAEGGRVVLARAEVAQLRKAAGNVLILKNADEVPA